MAIRGMAHHTAATEHGAALIRGGGGEQSKLVGVAPPDWTLRGYGLGFDLGVRRRVRQRGGGGEISPGGPLAPLLEAEEMEAGRQAPGLLKGGREEERSFLLSWCGRAPPPPASTVMAAGGGDLGVAGPGPLATGKGRPSPMAEREAPHE